MSDREEDLDDETLTTIGRMTVRFADAEFIANHLLWILITGKGEDGWLGPRLTAGESIEWVLSRIALLAPMRVGDHHVDAISGWIAEVRSVKRERNLLVHSSLGVSEDDPTELFALTLRRGEFGSRPYSKERLAQVEEEAVQLVDNGLNVMQAVGRQLWPHVYKN